jgi:hypothetical protein
MNREPFGTDHATRFTDPIAAVDHIRRIARETAAASGYRAASAAVMGVRREYRIMPLQRGDASAERLAAWDAVRLEARALVPLAMGGSQDHAWFDQRAATPADQPVPDQPAWAPDPPAALQAAALRPPTPAAAPTPLPSPAATPGRPPSP